MSPTLSLKSDKFRKQRGGHSRWLLLQCEKCKQAIAVYQKDGPGMLKRLYLDRITQPESIAHSKNKTLTCKSCKTLLGVLYVYEKEKRLAYRLFAGAVGKKVVKGERASTVFLA